MPTNRGGETIDEALERLRAELVTIETTVKRAETNGQANTMNGSHVTEIAFERAVRRQGQVRLQIRGLERRLAGKSPRSNMAIIKSVSS